MHLDGKQTPNIWVQADKTAETDDTQFLKNGPVRWHSPGFYDAFY